MSVLLPFAAAMLLAVGEPSPTADRVPAARPVESIVATIPFTLDHNRMLVEIEFVRPDGSARAASAWVDTGSEFLTMARTLARDLGLDVPGFEEQERPVEIASPALSLRAGGVSLRTEGVRWRMAAGARPWAGIPAEANLPASLLRHYHVIFDYPARLLTIAPPGLLRPGGVQVPCRVNAETGLFMIEATIDGQKVPFGVDNGSAGTWVSDSLTTAWETRYPDRPRMTGAAGSANFFGFPFETSGALVELPEIGIASLRAHDVAALGVPQGLFDWYSNKSAGAVLGFVGANVLRGFRLEVDFANQTTYWTAGPAEASDDLDMVGLTLRPEADGTFTIAGSVMRGGRPVVEGVEAGDRLIRVGDLECAGATMGAVVDALRGTPGSARTLVVERVGEPVTIAVTVLRLPGPDPAR